MPRSEPIAVPWSQRWRWIRFQLLPIGSFGLAVILTAILWSRQVGTTTAVGEVFAPRMDLASNVDGLLVPISPDPAGEVRLFQKVSANQVVARLDEAPTTAALATARTQLKTLQEELRKASEEERLAQSDREQSRNNLAQELARWVEDRRLRALVLRTEIEADKILHQQFSEQFELSSGPAARSSLSKLEIITAKYQRDMLYKKIDQNEAALKEANQQVADARERQRTLAPSAVAEIEPLLAPVRAEIDMQEAAIREIELTVDQLQIRSPINGVVAAVLKRPGQTVTAGEAIVTVAAEDGEYIVGYFRQGRHAQPAPQMAVHIRRRNVPVETLNSSIAQVGPTYELIPPEQTPDPNVPLWGRPARIDIPRGVKLTPGELVNIRLLPHSPAEPPRSSAVGSQTADKSGT